MNANITNLKKAKSHIEKIIQMEEEGRYCIDVMQQLNAVIGYLNSVKSNKLKNHLSSCFVSGMKSKSKKVQERLIDEVIQVTKISK